MAHDPFHFCVAFLPLALYFFALGMVNLTRRPLLTTGARDLAAVGIGIVGLVMVGPMELFIPEVTAIHFNSFAGPYFIWVLMLTFYSLCLSLVVLISRPRLVIYNLRVEELRPVLARVVSRLDANARWAGDSLVLPGKGKNKTNQESAESPPVAVQLHLEVTPGLRHISLVSNGPVQNYHGWQMLETELASELRQVGVSWNPVGWGLVAGSMLLLIVCTTMMLYDPRAVAQGMQDMFMR